MTRVRQFLDGTDDYVSWTRNFFPAKLLTRTRAADGVGYRWRYTWAEQVLDPDTAGYLTLDGGRAGSLSDCWAVEVNDAPAPLLIVVPMRLRGIAAGGEQVYEFWCPPQTLLARITGGGTAAGADYSWVERDDVGDVTNGHDSDGTVGDMPAHELHGATNVPIGTIVRLRLSESGLFYTFSEVPFRVADVEDDASPTEYDWFLPVTNLRVDRYTGLRVFGTSHLGPDATLKGIAASATQQGMVSLTAQTMGDGDKTFPKDVYIQDDLLVTGFGDFGEAVFCARLDALGDGSFGGLIAVTGSATIGDNLYVGPLGGILSTDMGTHLVQIGTVGGTPMSLAVDGDINGDDDITAGGDVTASGKVLAGTVFNCTGFDGVTGTGGAGDEFVGGICTALGGGGGGPTIVVGTTPVTGGTSGDLLYVGPLGTVGSTPQAALEQGGTGSDLSATGPGVVLQGSAGADLTVGAVPLGTPGYVSGVLPGENGGLGLDLTGLAPGLFLVTDGSGTITGTSVIDGGSF